MGGCRDRVYCADPKCAEFLEPRTHVKHGVTQLSYAVCQGEGCGKTTCTVCKGLVAGDAGVHVCEEDNENYKQFKELARRKRYRECPACGSVVELKEACNRVT